MNALLTNKSKHLWLELSYSKSNGHSYATYSPPAGYALQSAILNGAPSTDLGIDLITRNSSTGVYTIRLNWEYSGSWSTQLCIVKN